MFQLKMAVYLIFHSISTFSLTVHFTKSLHYFTLIQLISLGMYSLFVAELCFYGDDRANYLSLLNQ